MGVIMSASTFGKTNQSVGSNSAIIMILVKMSPKLWSYHLVLVIQKITFNYNIMGLVLPVLMVTF